MNFYNLDFFKQSDSLCAEDFNESDETIKINLAFILSISSVITFDLPFSGKFVGKYAIVTMSNDDNYIVREKSHSLLTFEIDRIHSIKLRSEKD